MLGSPFTALKRHLALEKLEPLMIATDPGDIVGLRDRALIAAMVYSFARVGTFRPRG